MPEINKEKILSIIRDKHPSTIGALRNIIKEVGFQVGDEDLTALVKGLLEEGAISLDNSSSPVSFSDYLFDTSRSGWMYLSLVIALAETLLVESKPSDVLLSTFRLLLGLALLGFIPGYCIVKLTFPRGGLAILEQVVLSIFLSILVSILTGVVLGSQNALQATSNVLFLAILTFALSVSAAYRSYGSSNQAIESRRLRA